RERLYGSFVKVEPPPKVYGRGLAVFDDDRQEGEKLADVPLGAPAFPNGHAFRHPEGGGEHGYFPHPFPLLRVRATAESFRRKEEYEAYTFLVDGRVERDGQGRPRYAWRKQAAPLGPEEERRLLREKQLRPEEARWRLHDRDGGK